MNKANNSKYPIFLLASTIFLLNTTMSVSAHETESTISSELGESALHDDQAPSIEEENRIILHAKKMGIGENPAIRKQGRRAGDTANKTGRWDNVQNWPVIPVFVSLLYDGRVLAFDSVGDGPTESYQNQSFSRATIWNPATNQFTDARVDTGYNIFCSGFASLPDGRLFIAGGNADTVLNGLRQTHLFTPTENSWGLESDMEASRWYPAVTPLANGEMLITGGGPALSEVRQIDGQLRKLTGAKKDYWANRDYPWLQTAPDGRVAFVGPNKHIGYVTTSGSGSWDAMGSRDNATRGYGSYAMYDIGKVLVAGGGYQRSGHDQRSSVTIDLNNNSVSATESMSHRRRQHNLTVLADGTVLATGGFSSNEGLVDLNNAVFNAELWNPSTGKWTVLASEARARQYHSTALLLPDGRVMSAGGGICGKCQQDGYLQKNAQFFSPPYLFESDGNLASRPVIDNVSDEMGYSQSFIVESPQANQISKVAMVRTGSVTHSQNMEQRYIPLSFTKQSGALTITAPNNANIAPPGHYMLFIIDNSGVPSVAKIVKVNNVVVQQPVTSNAICEAGVDPQTIKKGEGTALWWWSDSVTSATINQGVGSVATPSDYKWLTPLKTTTYKMTARDANGATTSCEATVVVEEQTIETNPPVCEMGADPQIINSGEGTALWWWSQNAASANVDNGIGGVNVPSDYKWFYPTRTTTYFMNVVGTNGSTTNCQTMITVR